ncbi:MAG TPA: hypothetical protein VE998_09075 [Terriglobales bacterium]|nr:hypothetical protein [Terriglobales bacterium]
MATPADAELILKLYDFRREAKMREARNWFVNFNPSSYEDFAKTVFAFGAQENAYFRQVTSYWETAASLVLHGTIDEELFFDTQGEMWFVFTKLKPYLAQFRQQLKAPEALKNVEAVATRSQRGQERIRMMEERFKMFAQMRAQSQQQQAQAKSA